MKLLLSVFRMRSFKKFFEVLRFDILRFGGTLGAVSALFHLLLCLIERLTKDTDWTEHQKKRISFFVAGFASSIPLAVGLQPGELSLLKLLFFPLAYRCLCNKSLEIGLVH